AIPAVPGKVRGDEVTEVLLEPAGKHRAGRVDVVVAGDDRAALRRLGDGAQGITRSLELALQRIGGEIAADEQMVRPGRCVFGDGAEGLGRAGVGRLTAAEGELRAGDATAPPQTRSEERRVGKECRSRVAPEQ